MPNVCKICSDPRVREINRRLISGAVIRTLAAEFGVSKASLYAHFHNHLPKTLGRAFQRSIVNHNNKHLERVEREQISDNFDLETRFKFIISETEAILEQAKQEGEKMVALKSLDGLRSTYQLLITALDKLEAQKQLELELLKAEQIQSGEYQQELISESLQILTDDELTVLNRLLRKVRNQTDELIIRNGRIYEL